MDESKLATPTIETTPKRRLSRVWIVPIVAFVIGAGVVVQSIRERGPLVEIRFHKAQGITAGKTEVRRNDVVVGLVEEVQLTDDLEQVIVKARMEPFMRPYLGDTTQFWVVSANISGTSLSGLSTLLSGAYVEVDWDEPPSDRSRRFVGLENPPMTPPGSAGAHFQLRSDDAGSIGVGSPVFYRRIKVGQIESQQISEDFTHVKYDAFIDAPYHRLLNPATHFWNVSGVAVDAGTDGLVVRFNSIESLLAGGIEFADIGKTMGTAELPEDTEFIIYANRDAAVESQYFAPEGSGYFFMAIFDEPIRGLDIGAPIEWQGIRIGNVRDIVLDLGDITKDESLIYAVLELQPSRIGLEDVPEDILRQNISSWVRDGMRVQLASGNILTGKKLVRFVDYAAPPDDTMTVDFAALPFPELPTTASNLGAVTQNVEQIVANVAELPLDQLVGAIIRLLNDTDALVANPAARELPAALNDALAAVSGAVGNIDVATRDLPELIAGLNAIAVAGETTLAGLAPESALYIDLSSAIRELRDATRSLAALAARLEEKPNALILGR